MADFCKKCSIEVWGEDGGDLAGLTTPDQQAAGLYCEALCETCGFILVNPDGSRKAFLRDPSRSPPETPNVSMKELDMNDVFYAEPGKAFATTRDVWSSIFMRRTGESPTNAAQAVESWIADGRLVKRTGD